MQRIFYIIYEYWTLNVQYSTFRNIMLTITHNMCNSWYIMYKYVHLCIFQWNMLGIEHIRGSGPLFWGPAALERRNEEDPEIPDSGYGAFMLRKHWISVFSNMKRKFSCNYMHPHVIVTHYTWNHQFHVNNV